MRYYRGVLGLKHSQTRWIFPKTPATCRFYRVLASIRDSTIKTKDTTLGPPVSVNRQRPDAPAKTVAYTLVATTTHCQKNWKYRNQKMLNATLHGHLCRTTPKIATRVSIYSAVYKHHWQSINTWLLHAGRQRRRKRLSKQPILWKFLLDALNEPGTYGTMIHWVDKSEGTFQVGNNNASWFTHSTTLRVRFWHIESRWKRLRSRDRVIPVTVVSQPVIKQEMIRRSADSELHSSEIHVRVRVAYSLKTDIYSVDMWNHSVLENTMVKRLASFDSSDDTFQGHSNCQCYVVQIACANYIHLQTLWHKVATASVAIIPVARCKTNIYSRGRGCRYKRERNHRLGHVPCLYINIYKYI